MNPYLERADLWPNVHSSLIIALRDELAPLLRTRYYVAVEERTVRLDFDDVAFAAARSPTPLDTNALASPNHMLHALYDRAGYDLRIDYRADAEPPLHDDDAAWADALLRAAGLR